MPLWFLRKLIFREISQKKLHFRIFFLFCGSKNAKPNAFSCVQFLLGICVNFFAHFLHNIWEYFVRKISHFFKCNLCQTYFAQSPFFFVINVQNAKFARNDSSIPLETLFKNIQFTLTNFNSSKFHHCVSLSVICNYSYKIQMLWFTFVDGF